MSRKKRRTREQKQRHEARRERAASQAHRARESVEAQLLTGPAAATIDQLAGVVQDAATTGDRDLMLQVRRWACAGACSDEELSQVFWDAAKGMSARDRFLAEAEAILAFMESGRSQAGIRLGRLLAESDLSSVARPGDMPAKAARLLAAATDEPWVVELLLLADPSELSPLSEQQGGDEEDTGAAAYAEEFWRTDGGAVAIRGFDYQSEVALLWLVRSLDPTNRIESVGLERIEDIEMRFDGAPSNPDFSKLAPHLFIQAKTRSDSEGRWTIARLTEAGVLPRFAELHQSFPEANLLFVSNQALGEDAVALVRVCEQLRTSGLSLAELAAREAGSALALTRAESAAVDGVRRGLGDQCPSEDDLSALLSHLHFQRLQDELRDGAVVALGQTTGKPVGVARLQHALLYLEVFERSKARAIITPDRARQLVDTVAEVVDSLLGQATDASALVKLVDFTATPEPDPAFREGVRARLRHILAGQDVVRDDALQEISASLAHSRVCIVRSPSGQGKSTCMYRWAYEHRDSFHTYELGRVDTPEAAEAIEGLLRAAVGAAAQPVLLLADDIFRADKRQVPHLLDLLGEYDGVYVLGTSREDEWRVIRPRGMSVGTVRLDLSAETAAAIASSLTDTGLEPAATWEEAYELSRALSGDHLLMEFLHYLRRGESLEDTLREQTGSLAEKCGDATPAADMILRYVATLDRFSAAAGWETLERLVGEEQRYLREAVVTLKDEHLILETDDGRYMGLHPLRSAVISDIYAETVPIQATVSVLSECLCANDLPAFLERALVADGVTPHEIIEVVARRIGVDLTAESLPSLFEAIFAAEQRRFAALCHAALEGMNVRTSLARLLPSERLPSSEKIGIFDIEAMPKAARDIAAALPQRSQGAEMMAQLLGSCTTQTLAAEIDGMPRTAAAILDWVGWQNTQMGQRLLQTLGTEPLANYTASCRIEELAELGRAMARIDPDVAVAFFEALGGDDGGVRRVLQSDYRIKSVLPRSTGEWECRWWATDDLPSGFPKSPLIRGDTPEEASWSLGELLIGVLPQASQVEVQPVDETGDEWGYRDYRPQKCVIRDRLNKMDQAARNRIWSHVFTEPYRARTWAAHQATLDRTRHRATSLAQGLCSLFLPILPVEPGQMEQGDFGRQLNSLIKQGHRLHEEAHRLPIVPEDVPALSATPSDQTQEGPPTLTDLLPTYFDRLLNGFEFLLDVMLARNERAAILPAVNAGMAVSQQDEMIDVLSSPGVPYRRNPALEQDERRALLGFADLARTATDPAFADVKQHARNCAPQLRALEALLANALGLPSSQRDRILANASRLAEQLRQRLPNAPRVSELANRLSRAALDCEAAETDTHGLVDLCSDLLALDGVGLAVDAYDSVWVSAWLKAATERIVGFEPPGVANVRLQADLQPGYTRDGWQDLEMVALVTPASFADLEADCAELMAALAAAWPEGRLGRLIAVYQTAHGVLPEVGWLLHCGVAENLSGTAVMRQWFPYQIEDDWLARHGLTLAPKAPVVAVLEDVVAKVIAAASWTQWLNAEASRAIPGLEHRHQAIAAECSRRIEEANAALGGIRGALSRLSEPIPASLAEEVADWADTCREELSMEYDAAEAGEADSQLIASIAALRRVDGQGDRASDLSPVFAAYLVLRVEAMDLGYL